MREKQGTITTPEQILDHSLLVIHQALRSKLIPGFVPQALNFIESRVFMLSDREYIDAGSQSVDIHGLSTEMIRDGVNKSTAAYIPHFYTDGQPAIILKRSYLTNTQLFELNRRLPQLLSEEFGHGFYKETPSRSLHEIRLNSYSIPHSSIEEVMNWLNFPSAKLEDIVVDSRGFKTVFVDMRTENYVIYGNEIEEARSAIFQAVLSSILIGQQQLPNTSAENQFLFGFSSYSRIENPRSQTASVFIAEYIKSANFPKRLAKLLKGIYNLNVNEFVESLSYFENLAFSEAILGSIEEQKRRRNLPR